MSVPVHEGHPGAERCPQRHYWPHLGDTAASNWTNDPSAPSVRRTTAARGENTPTTADVRAAWIRSHRWPDGTRLRGHDVELGEAFDRWFAAVTEGLRS